MTNLEKNLDYNIESCKETKVKFRPYLLFAFFVPALLFLTIYLLREVYPIGENSVLVLDLNAQYVYFFEELRDILLGEGSLLYSWQRAVGGEFMGMFAYYVASPFNLLIALFPEKAITEALLTIFTLKAGLSGFNFAVYLHYSDRAKNKISTVIFATMYALTSYALVNGHNTMWIDTLLFLPLLVLGLESLINKKKFILYTIMLSVIVFSNFYIGYMTCIFVAIYSVYYYLSYGYSKEYNKTGEKLHLLKSIFRVLIFSAIALAMSAVIILTIRYSLTFGKNDFSDPNFDLKSNFNFLELFAKFLPNSYDTVRPDGLPFVYCGVLSLILLPVYFFTKKITPREKICSGVLISILFFSFSASTIDIFWHGMQRPNWLNYRYSFMLCFFLLVLAHQAFHFIKDIKFNHIVAVCAGLVMLIVLIQAEEYSYIDSVMCIWISLLCVGVYLLTLYAFHKEKGSNFVSLIMAIIVSAELLINGYVCLDALDQDVIFSSRTSYREFIDELTPYVEYIKNKDDSFYRMEKTMHRKTNDNMTLDINGISSSTSTLNQSIITLLNQLGYSSKSHWSKYLGGTPASDSLLGIKYVISDNPLSDGIYKKIYEENEHYIYENPYYMSLAFGVSTDFEAIDFSSYANPFDLLNDTVTKMLGKDETVTIFKPIEDVSVSMNNAEYAPVNEEYFKYTPQNSSLPAEVTYTFTPHTIEQLYFFYPSDYPRKVSLSLNSKDYGTFFDNETDRIIPLRRFDPERPVNFTVKLEDDVLYLLRDQSFFYYLDTELFKSVMTELNECRFNIEEHSDTYLKGNINITEDEMMLFTSIPYDEGWKVICDGQELPVFKSADSLLAAEIPTGSHTLELKYLPDCFVKGASISVIGIMLFIALIIFDYILKLLQKRKQVKKQLAYDDFYESLNYSENKENIIVSDTKDTEDKNKNNQSEEEK